LKKLFILALPLLLALAAGAPAETVKDPSLKATSQSIGDEEVEPKDPFMAEVFAVLPGVAFHGSGNFYAGDTKFGTKMLTMEILGGGFAMWGYNIIHQPDNWGPYFGANSQQAGYWIKAGGVAMVLISWIGDIATASEAADSWNKDHALELQMDSLDGNGAKLTLMAKF
jgi:hypothetical protein